MKNLQAYIDQKNAWNAIFGQAPMTFPLSQTDADKIASTLDSDLSPENLHCDGEISQTQAQNKYNYYGRVIKELDRYCANQSLTVPQIEEYY